MLGYIECDLSHSAFDALREGTCIRDNHLSFHHWHWQETGVSRAQLPNPYTDISHLVLLQICSHFYLESLYHISQRGRAAAPPARQQMQIDADC